MIHSLDALGKHLSEISFTPIDKCMDENSFESTSELEDNCNILQIKRRITFYFFSSIYLEKNLP